MLWGGGGGGGGEMNSLFASSDPQGLNRPSVPARTMMVKEVGGPRQCESSCVLR